MFLPKVAQIPHLSIGMIVFVCFAKQEPGRTRQIFLATLYIDFILSSVVRTFMQTFGGTYETHWSDVISSVRMSEVLSSSHELFP